MAYLNTHMAIINAGYKLEQVVGGCFRRTPSKQNYYSVVDYYTEKEVLEMMSQAEYLELEENYTYIGGYILLDDGTCMKYDNIGKSWYHLPRLV